MFDFSKLAVVCLNKISFSLPLALTLCSRSGRQTRFPFEKSEEAPSFPSPGFFQHVSWPPPMCALFPVSRCSRPSQIFTFKTRKGTPLSLVVIIIQTGRLPAAQPLNSPFPDWSSLYEESWPPNNFWSEHFPLFLVSPRAFAAIHGRCPFCRP